MKSITEHKTFSSKTVTAPGGRCYIASPDDDVTLLQRHTKWGDDPDAIWAGVELTLHPESLKPALFLYRYKRGPDIKGGLCGKNEFITIDKLLDDFIERAEEEEKRKKEEKATYYELAIEHLENIREAAIEDKEDDSVDIIEEVIDELKEIKNKEEI